MLAGLSEGRLPDTVARKQLLLLLLLLLGDLVPGEPFLAPCSIAGNPAASFMPHGTCTIKGSKTRMEGHDTGSTGVSSVAVSSSASLTVLS